jgi:hypothetical protein
MSLVRAGRKLLILAVLFCPMLAYGQGGGFTQIRAQVEPLPSCTPSTAPQQSQPMIWDITAQSIKICTAPNTWATLSGGGGGGTPANPAFSVQVNNAGSFGSIPLGNSGAPLISAGAGAFAAFQAINLAGGSNVLTGILPAANLPATSVNAITNDTNVTGAISAQTLTLGWTGSLAKSRTLATTVYTDQSNTYTAGPQVFPGGDFFAGGVNTQTGASYTFVASDINKFVTFSNGSAVAVGLPRATTAGFTSGATIHTFNLGVGAVTITPTTSTINGNATLVLNQNQGAFIESDGTNYSAWVSSAPSGSGTVTSVSETFTGGLISVAGVPITTSGTIALTVAGTSGGIPYFSGSTTWGSSAALTLNGVVLGGGAGGAPTVTTADSTTTHALFATAGAPAFRALVTGDLPAISWALPTTGTATSVATFPGGDLFNGGINEQTGTSYTMVASDENKLITFANASAVGVTLPQATTAGFTSGAFFPVFNEGPGTVTITPTTSTINDVTTLVLTSGTGATIFSDGVNYSALIGGSGGGGFTNPMTTLGDMIYENATPTAARLAGPTSPSGITESLCSTPAGGVAGTPAWCIPGVPIDTQAGTSYSIPITDDVSFLTGNNASATAWSGFTLANNYVFSFENLGAGLITYTPASGTVNGNATQIIPRYWFGFHYTNNTNTFMPVMPTIQAFPSGCSNPIAFASATGVISCSTLTGGMFANFSAHQFLGNNTGSTAAAAPLLIGASDTTPNFYAVATGLVNVLAVTLSPAATALTAGLEVDFLPNLANTTTNPTLNVNGLGAATITKLGTAALAVSDLTTTAIAKVIYDGTGWELQNPQATSVGGTVNNCSTTGGVAYYAATGTAVSCLPSVVESAGQIALGVAGTTQGNLTISGSTSGTVTLTTQAAAGSPTVTWGTSTGTPAVTASSPLAITTATGNETCATCVTSASSLTNNLIVVGSGGGQGTSSLAAGTAKQVLTAGTPPAWIDFPDYHYLPAAANEAGTAAGGWDCNSATPTPTLRAGTNNKGAFYLWGASDVCQIHIGFLGDWDTAANPNVRLRLASTDTTSGHTIIMQVATSCSKGDGSTTDDVAFNTAQSFSTVTLNTTANQQWDATLSNITMTGCVAGGILRLQLSRTTDTATNVEIYGLGITIPRLIAVQAN